MALASDKDLLDLLRRLEARNAELEKGLREERLAIAAYLLDRADQYTTDSGHWIALADRVGPVLNGEARDMWDRGETTDLRERVETIAGGGRGTQT